jgi:protoporphyrinogen oxidase
MKNVYIIGGGISGLSIAQLLKDYYSVKVFEKEDRPGGLIKCEKIKGTLYHTVGGHVFNSHKENVLNWFWKFFDRDKEFVKTDRNAVVSMADGKIVDYPIENHIYQLNELIMKNVIYDLITIIKSNKIAPANFEEFLRGRFGDTLYKEYFQPYNEKIWHRDLKKIPLFWLEGKLPMPSVDEIIYNNFNHVKEFNMVHSSFYYPQSNGSQFIADRLAEGLNIAYNKKIEKIEKTFNGWLVNGEKCDKVIFCGNIKDLPSLLVGVDISAFEQSLAKLEYHGTTSVLCEIEKNPYSWIYMPSHEHLSHRIICTGNFSESNNATGKLTATIEFTNSISQTDIFESLNKIPFAPIYLTHRYTQYTYPIQDQTTRAILNNLKNLLASQNMYILGRFAEWEYYNMDAAIDAAMKLSQYFIA